jgi:zinc protease
VKRQTPQKKRVPKGFFDAGGLAVTIEESHALPLVDFELLFRTGGVQDPAGAEGLTRTTFRTLRRGTRRMNGPAVEEAIARLGARLGIDISTSYVRVHGSVIKRNLEPFFALVASLLAAPAFRAADLAQAKRETKAELDRLRDSDRALAGRWFRRTLYAGHPYARSLAGTTNSLQKTSVDDLRACYARHVVAPNLLIGFSGDVDRAEATRLVETHLGFLPTRVAPLERIAAPRQKPGRRAIVVDKPARTQTQVCIGTLGIAAGDRRYFPLEVANTAFGGTFTSTLVQEVREKRGWSYGVYSRIGMDRQRDTFTMWSHPSAADAVACIALELELLERFTSGGLRKKDFDFAKKYMANSRCFEVDTAPKRLEPRLDVALFGLPTGYWDEYEKHLAAVTLSASRKAVAEVISPDDLVIAITATASDIVPSLEKLPGIRSVEVVPYDRE